MLAFALLFDALLVTVVFFYFVKKSNVFNPIFIYLFFHVYAFSIRGWSVLFGSPKMYETRGYFESITDNEILRGVILADISLLVFSISFFLACNKVKYFERTISLKPIKRPNFRFSNGSILLVCIFFLPVGILSFVMTKTTNLNFNSGFISIPSLWIPSILLMLVYFKGIRWYFYVPLFIYVTIVAVQGYHRIQLIIPLFLCYLFYCNYHKILFPKFHHLILSLVFIMVFPFLKDVGKAYQEGDMEKVKHSFYIAVGLEEDYRNRESYLLDQYSGALTLYDRSDGLYFGKTYLSIISLPIPRFIYPSKPGLGDHIIEVSTPQRPYDLEGRVITYIGEAYANFSYLGVILIPAFLGWLISRWYNSIEFYTKNNAELFVYIVFMTTWIQVFRDGLVSFVMFGIFYNLPIIVAYCVSRSKFR
ncbi:O-antigen polymerase [Vibrio sp. E150_011]